MMMMKIIILRRKAKPIKMLLVQDQKNKHNLVLVQLKKLSSAFLLLKKFNATKDCSLLISPSKVCILLRTKCLKIQRITMISIEMTRDLHGSVLVMTVEFRTFNTFKEKNNK